ncbi:MAG: M48 family metalloprotease [Gammaproteobacteria bacterium]|nr:M48 family metalloprotease [Gammaproteobacteria bacterium]MDH3856645.1 M48 family metalloprotease [Gammaproteobacteria bacterium]
MKYATLLILMLSFALSACAINPVTGKQDFVTISEAEEINQGRRYHKEIIATYGIYDDPALQQYVNRIGQELAAKSHRENLKFTFTVLDSPDINAFALPGGYVYVTRGIMAYLGSEAELAGVIGHEIGHVTARHSVRQQGGQLASNILSILVAATTGDQALGNLSQQLSTGLIRGYGRDHELEADRLGAEYLHIAGYDPENMLEVIGVLKDQEVYEKALAASENRQPNIYHGVFSTHPRNDDRLKTVVRKAKKLSVKTYRDNNQAGYEKMIDGMLWGPSVKQGIVTNNRFAHPELGIGLQLPRGWKVDNNPQFLEARNPKTGALVQIGVMPLKKNETLDGMLKRLTQSKELKVSTKAYGVTASTRVKPRGGDYQPARVSAIALENSQALTLFGTSSKDHFPDTDKKLLDINQSFRRLNQAQIDAIKAPRLKIVNRNNRNFASLAQQSALEYEAENTLRLLNRAFPKGDITTFNKLKTITLDD